MARFEEKDYFSAFFFCPSSNILHSRTGTPSSCMCYIRCQLLGCQFHITISHLSGTLCNQQAWGSRGNLTFFQQCRYLDNILLLLGSTVQRDSACTQEDLLVLGQHSLPRLDLGPAYSTQLPGELQSSGARLAAGTGTDKEVTKCQETPAAAAYQRCCYSSYYQLPPVSSSWNTSHNLAQFPKSTSSQKKVLIRSWTPSSFSLDHNWSLACPFFSHHPPPRLHTSLPPSQVTSIN